MDPSFKIVLEAHVLLIEHFWELREMKQGDVMLSDQVLEYRFLQTNRFPVNIHLTSQGCGIYIIGGPKAPYKYSGFGRSICHEDRPTDHHRNLPASFGALSPLQRILVIATGPRMIFAAVVLASQDRTLPRHYTYLIDFATNHPLTISSRTLLRPATQSKELDPH
ncbi:hypothetical protein SODALDRAFT_361205 [Sodiomyces alkalinus F11]|uniref:Uncharacterized protein n=1 Tax=Sodiomyces alkalinus (strain CBS 110278 / VKM F-3762 / F11) TaxID=1314773 RepID=A0A3N2PSU6_SODAK|nr:hypothetical protein SODALDRAFT_361205 [Sodiomyces alkalinus F11]ROT37494.1 hypothetical protein SODALDRAFT_361205 [Sodiomyces alkalinus F11]